MQGLFDFFVLYFQDLAKAGPVAQTQFMGSALVVALVPYLGQWWAFRSRRSSFSLENLDLKRKVTETQADLAKCNQQFDEVKRHDPKTVAEHLDRDERDEHLPGLNKTAREYLEHHQVTIGRTSRIRMNHYLSMWEDGLASLQLARACALGAMASDPEDTDLAETLDEIERLIRIDAAPPEGQAALRDQEERDRLRKLLASAPDDLDALFAIGHRLNRQGKYRIERILRRRTERVARGPNGPGRHSPVHLTALFYVAKNLTDLGRAAEAEAAFHNLVPLEEKVRGAEHPQTLITRRVLAQSCCEQGAVARAQAALAPVPSDGGNPQPHHLIQFAVVQAFLADLQGDAVAAEAALARADAHAGSLDTGHYALRMLDHYRQTRTPGGPGGTTLWMLS